jgi:hypothetical protein
LKQGFGDWFGCSTTSRYRKRFARESSKTFHLF